MLVFITQMCGDLKSTKAKQAAELEEAVKGTEAVVADIQGIRGQDGKKASSNDDGGEPPENHRQVCSIIPSVWSAFHAF